MKAEAEYKPLGLSEVDMEAEVDPAEQGLLPPKYEYSNRKRIPTKSSKYSKIIHAVIICFELLLCAVLVAGFVILDNTRWSLSSGGSALDGLAKLGTYNTTMSFHNNSDLLRYTPEANHYWKELLDTGGVVSLNTKWALEQGLKPSHMSPSDSSQSIYQVDVFHALHCLNSIRENLVRRDDPPEWNEKHMLHCLDYVRHQLLCHPDLTLVTTKDLSEFVLDDVHTCKDYGAVLEWVKRHQWVEFPEWLKSKSKSKDPS